MNQYVESASILVVPSLEHLPKEKRTIEFIEVEEGLIFIATMNNDRNVISVYLTAKMILVPSNLGKGSTLREQERQDLLRKIAVLKLSLNKQKEKLLAVVSELDNYIRILESWKAKLAN